LNQKTIANYRKLPYNKVFKNFKHLFTVSISKNLITFGLLSSILISILVASLGVTSFAQSNNPSTSTDSAVLLLTIQPPVLIPNLPPVAVDDTVSTDFGQTINITVLANDTDPENRPLLIVSTTTPGNGTLTINPNKTITYIPDDDFSGTDIFSYVIRDDAGNQDTATVTITVRPNLPPDAKDDTNTTDFGKTTTINVLANDTDPENKPLTIVSTTTPSNGTVVINSDGTITYTPRSGFSGTDTFSYTIRDNIGNQDSATVTVTVRPQIIILPVIDNLLRTGGLGGGLGLISLILALLIYRQSKHKKKIKIDTH
jgi:hypothetical protein